MVCDDFICSFVVGLFGVINSVVELQIVSLYRHVQK